MQPFLLREKLLEQGIPLAKVIRMQQSNVSGKLYGHP
jgi:hypothetical protein